jgi:hypothetical protein
MTKQYLVSAIKPQVNRQYKWLCLILLTIISVICSIFYIGPLLAPYGLPSWAFLIIECMTAAYPLIWLLLWKNHRLSFLLASLILLTGDFAPALSSPGAALITLPNFIYLLYLNRNSRIKYYLLPLLLLTTLYCFNALFLNFIGKPFQISYRLVIDLGLLGIFGGGMIVYHMMYLPLVIYHLACTDKDYFRTYSFILSILINVVAVIGIYQFLISAIGVTGVRVSSIMRLSTRLAPFIVVSLPLLVSGLLDEKIPKLKIYWSISLALNMFLLMVTFTRGAIIAAGVLWLFLVVTLITSRSYKVLLYFCLGTASIVLLIAVLGYVLHIDYFFRFQAEYVESGMDKRESLWSVYLSGIGVEDTSFWRKLANTLFGYGWFSERAYLAALNPDTHNTFFSCFASFGLVGLVLYYIPYFWILFLSFVGSFKAKVLNMRPRYGMVCALLFLFIISGYVHNKLYSPIESAYVWVLIGILLRDELPLIFPKEVQKTSQSILSQSRKMLCLNR